jgi:hypothetical protein
MIRALGFLPMAVLGGCVTLLPPPPPPPRLFVLEAGAIAAEQGAPIDAVISVAPPSGERRPQQLRVALGSARL